MNDEELGRALGTALAPPPVQAVADAGLRLRTRAGRQRRDRALAGGALVVVLGVLVAVGLGRGVGGGAPAVPAAEPAAIGHSLLTTPMTITGIGSPAPSPGPCSLGAERTCGPAALVIDEVAGIGTTPAASGISAVDILLLDQDAAVLPSATGLGFGVRVDHDGYFATLTAGRLRIGMPTAADARQFVAGLGPVPVRTPRTGPGRLDVPLQLWAVESATSGSCALRPAAAGTIVTARSGECLTLRGPGVSIGTADVSVDRASTGPDAWLVTLEVTGRDSAALLAYTSGHVQDRIAFVIGGRAVGPVPTVEGPISSGLVLSMPDRDGADAVVTRLRP